MLPLLRLQPDGEALASSAVSNMMSALVFGGQLRAAPLVAQRVKGDPSTMWLHAIIDNIADQDSLRGHIRQLVADSLLPRNIAWKHTAGHKAGVSRLPTSFGHGQGSEDLRFYDYRRERFVPSLSRAALRLRLYQAREWAAYKLALDHR